jgi:hypothetical protein
MYEPFEIEAEGIKCMALAKPTVDSHRKICSRLGIFDGYEESLKEKGAVGGELEIVSTKHLLSRFLNSAARTQVLACIENDGCRQIAIEVFGLLSEGHIYLIDIAAGHGAGTISLLNTICKLREDGILSTDALDIDIFALDFSETSLNFYEEMLNSLSETHREFGLRVSLVKKRIDIRKDSEVKAAIDEIRLQAAGQAGTTLGFNPRYLLICSAISGVEKRVFLNEFAQSYQAITESFKDGSSAFLWVEPYTKKDWMPKYWQDFYDELKVIPEDDESTSKHMVKQKYDWVDPHLATKVPTTAGDYFLMKLAV